MPPQMLLRGVLAALLLLAGCATPVASQARPAGAPGAVAAQGTSRTIWVLKARGVCDGCAEAVSKMLFTAGLRSQIIGPEQIKDAVGPHDVLVIGGSEPDADGEWTVQKELLRVGAFDWIKAFIRGGGRYVGICSGGYLTEAWIDQAANVPGLAIFPGKVDNYDKRDKSTKFVQAHITRANARRWVYFQDGPGFWPRPGAPIEVLATYARGDAVAVAVFPYGKGKVAVSGPHYEADEGWAAQEGVVDRDGKDYDLGIEMFREVMK